MFMVDYGTARRKKPRRRYWWGAVGFAVGLWVGVTAAHRLDSTRPRPATTAAHGLAGVVAEKGEGRNDGT